MALRFLLPFLQYERDGRVKCERHGVLLFRYGYVFAVVHHVWAEASGADYHRAALKLAYRARQAEQLKRLFERYGLKALVGGHLGEARLFLVFRLSDLHHRTEPSNLDEHRLARGRVFAEFAFAGLVLLARVHCLFHRRLELAVKAFEHVGPLRLSFGDGVELVLHFGREVIVHDGRKIFHQEVVNHHSYVGWQQFAFLASCHFALCKVGNAVAVEHVNRVVAFLAFLVALLHVFPLLDGAYCRGVG